MGEVIKCKMVDPVCKTVYLHVHGSEDEHENGKGLKVEARLEERNEIERAEKVVR